MDGLRLAALERAGCPARDDGFEEFRVLPGIFTVVWDAR
jgi:hypothetical protein